MSEDRSIRVLGYAHIDLPMEFCGGVPLHSMEGLATLSMSYTLITDRDADGNEHHYLVDIGFDRPWIPAYGGFDDWESPEVVLAKVGVRPEQIEKLFVSHMHFDHVNAISHLPNAEVFVQWAEFEGWAKALSLPKRFAPQGKNSWLLSPFDRGDLTIFSQLAAEGRLHFMQDLDEAHPGIVGHLSTGHTCGIQWFTVPTAAKGDIVIATDCAMWYSNIEEMWPSGYTNGNAMEMLMTYDAISEYVGGDLDRVLPGHDMKVYDRHSSFRIGSNDVAEIAIASWDHSRDPAAATAV